MRGARGGGYPPAPGQPGGRQPLAVAIVHGIVTGGAQAHQVPGLPCQVWVERHRVNVMDCVRLDRLAISPALTALVPITPQYSGPQGLPPFRLVIHAHTPREKKKRQDPSRHMGGLGSGA